MQCELYKLLSDKDVCERPARIFANYTGLCTGSTYLVHLCVDCFNKINDALPDIYELKNHECSVKLVKWAKEMDKWMKKAG